MIFNLSKAATHMDALKIAIKLVSFEPQLYTIITIEMCAFLWRGRGRFGGEASKLLKHY